MAQEGGTNWTPSKPDLIRDRQRVWLQYDEWEPRALWPAVRVELTEVRKMVVRHLERVSSMLTSILPVLRCPRVSQRMRTLAWTRTFT